MSLLSGLNPDPSTLVFYFFMIAMYGVGRLPLRKGIRALWLGPLLLLVACRIILPIIQAEGVRCACLMKPIVRTVLLA